MVHVVTPRPSIGSALGNALGTFGASQFNKYQQNQQQQAQQKQQQLQNSQLNDALMQAQQMWNSPLPPEQKLIGLYQILSSHSPELAKNLGNQLLQANKATNEITNRQNEEQNVKDTTQNVFNRMGELLKEGTLGFGSEIKSKVFGGKTAQDVGEFQSLTGQLESALVDLVNRGTLSNARFKYITETLLPKPNDRKDIIVGKLKGLAQMLGLDPEVLENKVKEKSSAEKPGFIKLKDPQGIERWVPEQVAKTLTGAQ